MHKTMRRDYFCFYDPRIWFPKSIHIFVFPPDYESLWNRDKKTYFAHIVRKLDI